MPIITEQVTASAEMTNFYDVEVWQARKRQRYTVAQAREFAAEILAACDEVDTCIEEDRLAEAKRADYPKPAPPRPGLMHLLQGSADDPTHY